MRSRSVLLVACGLAGGCASKVVALRRPLPGAVAQPCTPAEAWTLRGNLGTTPVRGWVSSTEAGWNGELTVLGREDAFELVGQRAEGFPYEFGPDARPITEFECRLEVRSHGELFGTLDGRCTEPGDDEGAPFTVAGTWTIPPSPDETMPAFLSVPAYAGLPDELYAALLREGTNVAGCVPFVDVNEVRALPRGRRGVVYESVGCPEASSPRDVSRFRLALVDDADWAHPVFLGPLRGIEYDSGRASFAVYQRADHRRFFQIVFSNGWSSTSTGRDYLQRQSALFGLLPNGLAGPLFRLPDESSDGTSCAGPEDYDEFAFVELDGAPPEELVLAHTHVPVPCREGPPIEPEEPDATSFSAYRYEPELARFDRIPVSEPVLEVKWRHADAVDSSRPDESWREAPMRCQ